MLNQLHAMFCHHTEVILTIHGKRNYPRSFTIRHIFIGNYDARSFSSFFGIKIIVEFKFQSLQFFSRVGRYYFVRSIPHHFESGFCENIDVFASFRTNILKGWIYGQCWGRQFIPRGSTPCKQVCGRFALHLIFIGSTWTC